MSVLQAAPLPRFSQIDLLSERVLEFFAWRRIACYMRVDAWGDAMAAVTLHGCEQENKRCGAFLLPNKRPCDCPLTAVMLSQLRPPPSRRCNMS